MGTAWSEEDDGMAEEGSRLTLRSRLRGGNLQRYELARPWQGWDTAAGGSAHKRPDNGGKFRGL